MKATSDRYNRVLSVSTLLLSLSFVFAGCSRSHYREEADSEVYVAVQQASMGTPWQLPAEFTIEPAGQSRLFDPSDPDYPVLPQPGPFLYDYELPESVGHVSLVAHKGPPVRLLEGEKSFPEGREPTDDGELRGLPIQSIPETYWDDVPRQCLARMLEFESIRREYERKYNESPPAELFEQARRLSFREIVGLAILNSRDYQSRKEAVYSTALNVTLERFAYATKFSSGGSGTDTAYNFSRDDGSTTESLGILSSLQADKLLAFGGTLLANFTNSIVFTFDGPEGWSKDISSELAVGFTQSILQRDIVLNPLVQSERNLIYAAREFARFRRQFFFQLASQYYGLLRSYRGIEIESQNYFSLIRTFEQAQAEVRAGVETAPNPVSVDQFEQSMLGGRSSLISVCNGLERDLDGLKLTIGIPTETPINIALLELEDLTLRDEMEVAAERVRRWQNRVQDRRGQSLPDRGEILNADIFLVERLLEWLTLNRVLGIEVADPSELVELLAKLRVGQGRVDVARMLSELRRTLDPQVRSPTILVYQRVSDVIDELLGLARYQVGLTRKLGRDRDETARYEESLQQCRAQLESMSDRLGDILQDPQQERLQDLLEQARDLRSRLEDVIAGLDTLLGPEDQGPRTLEETIQLTDGLLKVSEELLTGARLGLPPVDMGGDEAMATALVQRLDLMNERGRLADDWRDIKLAADDLKSVLNLRASYAIGTKGDDAFNFTTDNSRAQVGLSVDLPLNRQAQRNQYRQTLINYQAQRRGLTELEDTIKADIRDDLRTLAETRIQYGIGVRRAALAAEQVISVRLQLALGIQGVRGTDLLLALQASREALTAVAASHIGYTIERARFALDLELLLLDDSGFWPEVNDSEYQPEPNLVYPEGAGPTYGPLPSRLWLSGAIKQQLDFPPPGHVPEAPRDDSDVALSPSKDVGVEVTEMASSTEKP